MNRGQIRFRNFRRTGAMSQWFGELSDGKRRRESPRTLARIRATVLYLNSRSSHGHCRAKMAGDDFKKRTEYS
jgi:hypothetical protein